jgi:hypothetical protein
LVRDLTPVMVVAGISERSVDTKVCIEIPHMISDDVDHDIDASFVTGTDKVDEILFAAEVLVEFVEISTPIAVVSSVTIIDNRRDPYGIKAHSLNIVQIVDDSSISSSTIVA